MSSVTPRERFNAIRQPRLTIRWDMSRESLLALGCFALMDALDYGVTMAGERCPQCGTGFEDQSHEVDRLRAALREAWGELGERGHADRQAVDEARGILARALTTQEDR